MIEPNGALPLRVDLVLRIASSGAGTPDASLCCDLLIPEQWLPEADLEWPPVAVELRRDEAGQDVVVLRAAGPLAVFEAVQTPAFSAEWLDEVLRNNWRAPSPPRLLVPVSCDATYTRGMLFPTTFSYHRFQPIVAQSRKHSILTQYERLADY